MGGSNICISASGSTSNNSLPETPEHPQPAPSGVRFMENIPGENPIIVPTPSTADLIDLGQIPKKHEPLPPDAVPTKPCIKKPRPFPRRQRPKIFDQVEGLDMYMSGVEGERMEAALEKVAFVMEMRDSRRRRQRAAEIGIRPRLDLPDDELDNAGEILGKPLPKRRLIRSLTTPFRRLGAFLKRHARSRAEV